MQDNIRWIFRQIRTSNKYIAFLVLQLLLSTSILLLAFFHSRSFRSPIALGLEYSLIVCILFDLLIRFYSEDSFFKNRNNVIDLIIFLALIVIVLIVTFVPDQEGIFETDDIILLSVIVVRYLIQIIRLGCMIKNSRDTVAMTVEMKGIDFNQNQQGTHGSEHTQNVSMQRSQIMRGYLQRMQGESNKNQDIHVELNEEI